MIFDFYPWKIDIDVESTKKLYAENDYSFDKKATKKFYETLTPKQKEFFLTIGVNPNNIGVKEEFYDIPERNVHSFAVSFLICGSFCAIPSFDMDLYVEGNMFEKDVFKKLDIIKVQNYSEGNYAFDVDGLPCEFKHPFILKKGETFEKWDCGYVLGTILIFK